MTITLLTKNKGPKISKYIYGQFSEHLGHGVYGGIYVGNHSKIPNVNGIRTDVVQALKQIHVPVLRWPGGLFADTYHWKDGIGPKSKRKKIINTHWGDVIENNSFGTDEYFELLKQLNAEAYINCNMGSGTIREMAEWVEYITKPGQSPMSKLRESNGHKEPWHLKFLGIGNESWGGGGNMRPEYYSDVYRQYQCFLPQYDPEHPIYKVACGPNEDNYKWTDTVMRIAGRYLNGLTLHFYTLPKGDWKTSKGSSINFPVNEWFSTMKRAKKMDELITKHAKVMDKYDPDKRVNLIVDEWGTWYDTLPGTNPGFLEQQNTMRDALVAAITLNIFHKHADRVYMANIAQMVNVLQSMLMTKGSKMIKTPTYYVFDMYKRHMNANLIPVNGKIPENITLTATRKDGEINISIGNYGLNADTRIEFALDCDINKIKESEIITSHKMNDHNDFENPERIKEEKFEQIHIDRKKVTVTIPAISVVSFTLI